MQLEKTPCLCCQSSETPSCSLSSSTEKQGWAAIEPSPPAWGGWRGQRRQGSTCLAPQSSSCEPCHCSEVALGWLRLTQVLLRAEVCAGFLPGAGEADSSLLAFLFLSDEPKLPLSALAPIFTNLCSLSSSCSLTSPCQPPRASLFVGIAPIGWCVLIKACNFATQFLIFRPAMPPLALCAKLSQTGLYS